MSASKPLRIAYLTGSLEMGGSERQMVHLARHLPHDRFVVDFILLSKRGLLTPIAKAAGAHVHFLGWTRRRDWLHPLKWPWDLLRSAIALRRGHYDIVDAWLFEAYAISSITRPFHRTPLLVSGRRSLSNFKEDYGQFKKLLDTVAKRTSNGIVANSEAVRADVARYEGIPPQRIRVIRNGVETPPLMSTSERDAIRANWGFVADEVVIGSVANYKPGKGLEALLQVTAKLRMSAPHMRMVLVGEGSLRTTLERMIDELQLTETVRLHGEESDARRLYGAFDIVVHASESEGLPNAVLEAAAAGRPIVATNAGGTPEIVRDGESGLLVPTGDLGALETSLWRVIDDPTLRQRLGASARERAKTIFSMDRFVSETAAFYEELAASKGIR